MSEQNKITEEELKSLQEAVTNLNQAKTILGDVTTQAHLTQLEVLKFSERLGGVQKELEAKYGSITVDVGTGEYQLSEETTEE
jgi:hypothetical protein